MSDQAPAPTPAADAPKNNFADVASETMSSFSSAEPRPGRGRTFSPTTREAFKRVADQVKAVVAEHGTVADDDVVAVDPPPEDKQAAAPAPAPSASPAAAADAAARATNQQATSEAIAAHHEAMARQLAEREKALTEREKSRRDYLDQLREDPAATIREMIREAHGLTSDDQVKEYAMDLVTDLSGSVLGLEVPEAQKVKQERRKVERLLKEHNAKLAKSEAARKEAEQREQETRKNSAVKGVILERLTTVKDKYPYLMAEDAPHELVFSVAEKLAESDPTWVPSWEDAAHRAESHLKKQAEAYVSRRRHLLIPESTPKQPAKATPPQERPPGSRSAATLTNGNAQESSAKAATVRPTSNEDRRRASLAKLRGSLVADE